MQDIENAVIARDDPMVDDVRALLDERLAHARSRSPAGGHNLYDTAALARPDVAFWTARLGGFLIGCGGLLRLAPTQGEIKAMFLRPMARGHGVSHRLLATIEAEARAQGMTELFLETGHDATAAVSLYHKTGYGACGPFGTYVQDPSSIFMTKRLA
jgi:putative acetyltransferase